MFAPSFCREIQCFSHWSSGGKWRRKLQSSPSRIFSSWTFCFVFWKKHLFKLVATIEMYAAYLYAKDSSLIFPWWINVIFFADTNRLLWQIHHCNNSLWVSFAQTSDSRFINGGSKSTHLNRIVVLCKFGF